MRFYARPSARMVRQVLADVFVLGWTVAWWFVGRFTDQVVRAIAEPARRSAELGVGVRDQLDEVARQAGGVPVVGEGLSAPFSDLSGSVDAFVAAAEQQVASIELAATVGGWLTFAVPVLLVVLIWLPRRLAFIRQAGEVLRVAAAPGGEDLLALRALATHPVAELRAVASDPVTAWRAGDPAVVTRLAALELARAGVTRREATPRPS